MQVCRNIADYRAAIAGYRAASESVGLVTTMGALHAGHIALVAAARAQNDRVVTTIFVNPTQFGNRADLDNYPKTERTDLEMFKSAGVDAVLIPDMSEMYPPGDETIVETTRLAHVFHGLIRPGHFRGVATVVTKLLNIAQPDAAYFGEKDYQQLAVIRRMVADLLVPVRIAGVSTVREADGLAMSSRNVRLSTADRAAAIVLNRSLDAAAAIASPDTAIDDLKSAIARTIDAEPRGDLKGLDIVWAADFAPATGKLTAPVGIMISVEFGPPDNRVLLIDQREISP